MRRASRARDTIGGASIGGGGRGHSLIAWATLPSPASSLGTGGAASASPVSAVSAETSCTLSSSETDSSIIDALDSAAATPVASSVGTVERSLGRSLGSSSSFVELERSSSSRSSPELS